jgi:photosystem II stability/assembly factor-like uncharacterized protein
VEHQVDPNPFNERDFWGISAGDADTAVAVGTGGAVYATEDRGAHWVRRQTGSAAAILDLAATDADHAWAAGDNGDVLYTTDGGQFWHYVNIPVYETYFTFHGIDFADGNNGWVGGEHGALYHSTDGGRTWQPQSANLNPNQTVWAVEAVDAQTALLAAGGLYRTTDAGQTWRPAQLPPGVGAPFMDVFFVSASTGWAVGADRTIARSTDGGATWAAQSSGGSELLYRVSFADPNHGWAGGWNGALFHTTNGGATWQPQDADLPDRTSIMGVQAISAGVAWISGGGGGPDSRPFVKRTTDGGATWVAEALGNSNPLNTLSAILFTDANTGWAAGSTIPPLGGIFRRAPGSGPFLTPTPLASATRPPFQTPTSSPGQTATPGATATPPGPPTVTPCLIAFSDVPPGQPFYAFIRCLACRGIVGGYPCGGPGEPCPGAYFRPTNNITRGQVAKIVAEAAGFSDAVPSSRQTFTDVPPSGTFWLWIERLSSRGILGGYPCGGPFEPSNPPSNRPYFRPNHAVTRGQLSKIIAGAAGWTETPAGQTFEDVPPGNTFYLYIERLSSRMVIAGYPCGGAGEPCQPPTNRPYFRPNANATRGQMSKIAASAFFPNCPALIRR